MPEADTSYSNFDHEWDEGAKEALEGGEFWVRHIAWNHNSHMWRGEDGRFYEEIWRFHVHVATLVADTPDELVAKAGFDSDA